MFVKYCYEINGFVLMIYNKYKFKRITLILWKIELTTKINTQVPILKIIAVIFLSTLPKKKISIYLKKK